MRSPGDNSLILSSLDLTSSRLVLTQPQPANIMTSILSKLNRGADYGALSDNGSARWLSNYQPSFNSL